MSGAGLEVTLELWASSLRDVKARMRPLFSQERVAACAGQFLDGWNAPHFDRTDGTAQDGVDAGRSCRRSRSLAPAGHSRPGPLGDGTGPASSATAISSSSGSSTGSRAA